MFEILDLKFAYPNRDPLFEHLSYRFPEAGGILLMGDNGCGKSTLLKLLCAKLSPLGGEIKRSPKPLFYLPQDAAGRILGVNLEQDLNIWQMAGLNPEKVLNHPLMQGFAPQTWTMQTQELSKGTLQAYLNSVMLSLPDCYPVLDEPFAALDAHRAEILERELSQREGYLIVSHFQTQAAPRTVVRLEDGKLW